MLWKTNELKGCRLGALDGQIGHVKDFYFDDQAWTIRYLVADTGNWLPHRKVLLSPHAVNSIHPGAHLGETAREIGDTFNVPGIHAAHHPVIEVNLTKKQIEESPSIETHKPVSRQFEAQYFQYYGWPYYWPGPLLWGPMAYPDTDLVLPPPAAAEPPNRAEAEGEDAHLRSALEVSGYEIQALDRHFGHVEQFIFDDESWAVRYLVLDTRNWWPGKRVLISPLWISWVSWPELKVYVDLDRDTVQRAPEYDPAAPLTRAYEGKLFEHYNRPPYWSQGVTR